MPKSKKTVDLPVGGEIIEPHVNETEIETKKSKAKKPLEPLEPNFGVSPAQMGFTPSIPIPELCQFSRWNWSEKTYKINCKIKALDYKSWNRTSKAKRSFNKSRS